jgi:hypothetical protein
MDFKLFIDSLLTGTPVAILVALVGIVWQGIYVRSRDKSHDEQATRELRLEDKKFEQQRKIEELKFQLEDRRFTHQKEIEKMRFNYDQLRWREDLAHDIALKHVEVRLEEYSKAWAYIEGVARNKLDTGTLTKETTREIAQKIKTWRYSRGGLLAEEITRDAAYALQKALWEYNGEKTSYHRIRNARTIFRNALRADMGIGEIAGQTIYQLTEERQKIRKELNELQSQLGITTTTDQS